MKLEKAINELMEKCMSGEELVIGTCSPFRKCFDCMKEHGVDSTSFVLDKHFYGGIIVKLLIKDSKFFIQVTDNGIKGNNIAYSTYYRLFRGVSDDLATVEYEYDLEEYENKRCQHIQWYENESYTIKDIRDIITNRNNAFEIGEEIDILGNSFKISSINGSKIDLIGQDSHIIHCEILDDPSVDVQELLINYQSNEGFTYSMTIFK